MTDQESRWALRCILTTLTCEFRPDAVVDVVNVADVPANASAQRPLMHVRAGAAGVTELADRLRECNEALVILHFEVPPTELQPPVPHALVARPAITIADPRDPSQRTRYVAIGQSARAALVRVQQLALVTVTRANG